MDINGLLRRVRLNPFGNFGDLTTRQRELLNAISQMIANNEMISEETIKPRISRTTDIRCCFWGLWKKKVLITNNSQ